MTRISQRVEKLDVSGIRKVFDLAKDLKDPINFSIGQPDFSVPAPVKDAACQAILGDFNGYTPTQGMASLTEAVKKDALARGQRIEDVILTSGVSGGIFLSFSALLNAGDEVLIPDPGFLIYEKVAAFLDAKVTRIPIYPDFRMTAERIEAYLKPETKLLVLNYPSNPTGVGLTRDEIKDIADLLAKHPKVEVICDEIYRLFSYTDEFPSLAEYIDRAIVLDGFSKSHAMTGWRSGWAVGPREVIQQMAKMQQFTFVCTPSPAQHASLKALETDVSAQRESYRNKRDLMVSLLKDNFEIAQPDGTFYVFPKVPDSYKSGMAFTEAALKKNVLVIPGSVFSTRDTHFRISYAVPDEKIRQGADLLNSLC